MAPPTGEFLKPTVDKPTHPLRAGHQIKSPPQSQPSWGRCGTQQCRRATVTTASETDPDPSPGQRTRCPAGPKTDPCRMLRPLGTPLQLRAEREVDRQSTCPIANSRSAKVTCTESPATALHRHLHPRKTGFLSFSGLFSAHR